MLPAGDPGAFSHIVDTWKVVLMQLQHWENPQCDRAMYRTHSVTYSSIMCIYIYAANAS